MLRRILALPGAAWRRYWRMGCLGRLVVGALGLVLLASLGFGGLFLQLVHNAPALPALPAGIGAEGPGYAVRAVDGIPLLIDGALPYPTSFETTGRRRIDLAGRWEVRADSADFGAEVGWQRGDGGRWPTHPVPSTPNAVGGPFPDFQGPLWFRRSITLPPLVGARWRLWLDGALLRSTVWLNGVELGSREGGYLPYQLPLKGARPGENLLVVRTDPRLTETSLPPANRPRHRPGWAAYAGITRGVWLEAVPVAHVVKLAVTPQLDSGTAALAVECVAARVAGDAGRLEIALRDPSGALVAEAREELPAGEELIGRRLRLRVPGAELWSPSSPRLYTVAATWTAGGSRDEVTVKTGLRSIEVRGRGLFLNGDSLYLRGIAKHEDHPTWGATQPDSLMHADLDQIEALGASFVRISHYPHDVRALRAARDRGILLSEEIPLYQAGQGWLAWLGWDRDLGGFPASSFGLRQLHDPMLRANIQRQLAMMVERDRNNPALILWNVGNECYDFAGSRPFYQWLADCVRSFDTSRPLTYSELSYDTRLLDGAREAGEVFDLVSINMYYGWYYGDPEEAAAYLDRCLAQWPDKPLMITECGAGALRGRTVEDGIFPGEGFPGHQTFAESYQAELLTALWKVARARPGIVGFSPWVYQDFRCPWFPLHPLPGYNLKGIVDRWRVPKQGYHALQEAYRAAE